MNESCSFLQKISLLIASFLGLPIIASAHEVYVLTPQEIRTAVSTASPNPFAAISTNEQLFLIWGTVCAIAILIVLTFSISRLFERVFDRFLIPLKKYAPLLGRLTFGISLMASGYFGDFFGPELPVSGAINSPFLDHTLGYLLIIAGAFICLGLLTRFISFLGLILFAFTIYLYHSYMLMYVNYLGEMILFLILGGGMWSLDSSVTTLATIEKKFSGLRKSLERYSFLFLRILFGTALISASFYAKFVHSNLALKTVTDYHLTNYFHFTPLFLVLGAFIVEAIIGICFAIGFEIRFFALVFTFFLTLSILFFGEAVWPHIILFGVNFTLFAHGYDRYTVEMRFFQRRRRGEPVL